MQLFSPKGSPIIGTADLVPANALIKYDSFRIEDGELAFDWAGESEMCWDGQYIKEQNGEAVYVAENGTEWLEVQLVTAEGKCRRF